MEVSTAAEGAVGFCKLSLITDCPCAVSTAGGRGAGAASLDGSETDCPLGTSAGVSLARLTASSNGVLTFSVSTAVFRPVSIGICSGVLGLSASSNGVVTPVVSTAVCRPASVGGMSGGFGVTGAPAGGSSGGFSPVLNSSSVFTTSRRSLMVFPARGSTGFPSFPISGTGRVIPLRVAASRTPLKSVPVIKPLIDDSSTPVITPRDLSQPSMPGILPCAAKFSPMRVSALITAIEPPSPKELIVLSSSTRPGPCMNFVSPVASFAAVCMNTLANALPAGTCIMPPMDSASGPIAPKPRPSTLPKASALPAWF